MSKYTTQLRYICEQKAGYIESQDDYNQVIYKAYPKIIHPETPLFDTSYSSVLYPKIIRHYYFDEIAHETVGHFLMRLNTKLDEILPYYNQLYKSQLLEFNPLYDTDYYTKGKREDNNTDNRTRTDNLNSLRTDNLNSLRTDDLTGVRTDDLAAHSENTNWNLNSDTPQGTISDIGLQANAYLSNAQKQTGEADSTNTGTVTNKNTGTVNNSDTGTQNFANTGTQKNDAIIHNINEYAEHVYGKRGGMTYAAMLKEFRETFLNIDMQIIEELTRLFMQVY